MKNLKLFIWKIHFNIYIDNLNIIKKWQYYTTFLHIRLYRVKVCMGELKSKNYYDKISYTFNAF